MTKIVLTLLMLSNVLLALDWVKDLDTALATAQKEHKNIMVLVEGEHCRWCKKMKGRTLSDDTVEKRLKAYVLVKVFRENYHAMQKLPSVRGVPTIFFMKEDKEVIEDIIGYFNVGDFISYIDDVEKAIKKK